MAGVLNVLRNMVDSEPDLFYCNLHMANITNKNLVEIIKGLLAADADLGFLLRLENAELETLAACIRDRVGLAGK